MQECKVVFLDRDGVINKRPPVHEYVRCREDMIILPGVVNAIRRLNEAGFFVYVVSNQRGVSRKLMTMDDVNDIHEYLSAKLSEGGAHIDGYYVCPHGDNECECRKPKPGLLYNIEKDLNKSGYDIDKSLSVLIGDSDSDIEAGKSYGVDTIKIGKESSSVSDLNEAVCKVLGGC